MFKEAWLKGCAFFDTKNRKGEMVMDVAAITEMITTVGFPIACCIVMFRQNAKLQETLAEISLTMQRLTDKVTELEQRTK